MAHLVSHGFEAESEQLAAQPELQAADRLIARCYERLRSFEHIAGRVPESGARIGTLTGIADRVFTMAWNTKDLTYLQRAQVLDILLTVADLMARIPREQIREHK